MVLIIRNNRIQSRRHSKIKHLWSCVVNDTKQGNVEHVQKSDTLFMNNMAEEPSENMRQVKVMGLLFLYSAAMFTLPFAAFFGAQHVMRKEFQTDHFTTSCVSVLSAVITVNLIIASYAYRAYYEPDDPIKSDDQIVVDDRPKSINDLNTKED
ncbi:uncharacterized protein LOC105683633 [Athalia rosae]|uniref:uncharacterized protein LOC105683633 n=1 Tax=Athalia rosae TaxID=37344 RepID=UPI000625F6E0|nr:uncharacterized protein LOC105683633 [Athalia rosae]